MDAQPTQIDLDWLIEVLENSQEVQVINLHDGLGTYVTRSPGISPGWRVCGRERAKTSSPVVKFDDALSALSAARAECNNSD